MRIIRFPRSRTNSIDVLLEHANEVPDPRTIDRYGKRRKLRFSVNGRTLTITRTDKDEESYWYYSFNLRLYCPSDDIPAFSSTVYLYHGLGGDECAPKDVTEVNFHPSVTTIKDGDFKDCTSLVRIKIPDTITLIEQYAFKGCHSLRSIRFSLNLQHIERAAFYGCRSLEAVFLPPTDSQIGYRAFMYCGSLRFINGYDRLSPRLQNNVAMHKVCFGTSVNRQTIQECIVTHGTACATKVDNQKMTALHILCANPHVTGDAIRAYLQLAPEAAEQEDSKGMTPFQYLCRNDVSFLDESNFSSLMTLWYGCMPPQTERTGKKRKIIG